MTAPDQHMIDHALDVAAQSPCRSKRGVVLYDPSTGAFRGAGHNGPPQPLTCPGREICVGTCAGTCGQRSVHAEVRALRAAAEYRRNHPAGPYDLVHVELDADGGVVACLGPSCWQCSREILDVGFVGGVWLYEQEPRERCEGGWGGIIGHRRTCADGSEVLCPICSGSGYLGPVVAAWRYRTAEEFHRETLRNLGLEP